MLGVFEINLNQEFILLFTKFIELFINAELPPFFYQLITQTEIIPLAKDTYIIDKSIRPISKTETLNKIGGKLWLKMESNNIIKSMVPLQLGQGYKNGCEIISISVEEAMSSNPTFDLLSLDIRQAFPSISRNQCFKVKSKNISIF